jgi:hypothetical protein
VTALSRRHLFGLLAGAAAAPMMPVANPASARILGVDLAWEGGCATTLVERYPEPYLDGLVMRTVCTTIFYDDGRVETTWP